MTNDYPPRDPSDPREIACASIWEERGPNYQAPYAVVFAALQGAIAEHYRNGMWRQYTEASILHSWYFKWEEGLQPWSKRETRLWLPEPSVLYLRPIPKGGVVRSGQKRSGRGAHGSGPDELLVREA